MECGDDGKQDAHLQNGAATLATTADASVLSSSYLRTYSASHQEEDLQKAGLYAKQAVDSCAPGSPDRGLALLRLATVEYLLSQDSAAMLSEAVADFKAGMKLVPESAPERVEYGKAFLQALKSKLAKSISLDDLDEGINVANLIVSHSPERRKNGEIWYDLLAFYTRKFDVTGSRPASLVDAAIVAGEACLGDNGVSSSLRRGCHFTLCELYFGRFRASSIESDIDKAVEHGELSIKDAAPHDQNLARWHLALSRALAARFSAKGNTGDLHEATRCARQSVSYFKKGCGKDVNEAAVILNNLSNRLDDQYTAEGDPNVLKQAIRLARDALGLAQDAQDAQVQVFRQNLVSLLNSSFSDLGNQEDLEQAILLGYETASQTERTDPGRPAYLTALASSLVHRYRLGHALDDVREAIRLMREAIDLTNPSHISYNVMKSNLAKHLKLLHARTKDPGVIKEARDIQEEICRSSSRCSPDSPDRPRFLGHLANTYDDLFLETDDVTYSDRALELGDSVTAMRGPSDPSRGSSYTNQSARYWSRYQKLRETTALDRAIEYGRLGVRFCEVNDPNRALAANNLGNMLNERYNLGGAADDRAEALKVYLDAFGQSNALPTIRIEAARAAGILYGENQQWQDAWRALEQSVRMFPRLSPRSVPSGDQQDNLAHLSGISCLACSAAIMAGQRPETCLEILETGRGIISGLAMFLEGDILRLQQRHPEIYETFSTLRDRISKEPVASGAPWTSLESSRSLNEQFDRLLERIRTLDDFSSFLLSPSVDEVLSLCQRGPIVCINATELGSHAILVTQSGGIRILPLPRLSYERLEHEAAAFLRVSEVQSSTYDATNTTLRGLASWLWEAAVGPVLCSLGLVHPQTPPPPPAGKLPRVYWMPCGLLSHMPIHAAGIYKPRSRERAEEYVVSSYITTLKSAVRNRDAAASKQPWIPAWAEPLIVSMPTTPKMMPLLAEEEAAVVRHALGALNSAHSNTGTPPPPRSSAYVLTNRPKEEVKAALRRCTLAHFVCHGTSSAGAADPSRSALCLGAADAAQAETLTMAELAAMGMPAGRAKLAFLSACSTAENASGRLQDEVIHLASGFQLLGFSHVVATLWPASNAAAVLVAERFYGSLLLQDHLSGHDSGDAGREDRMADALHAAVKEVRLRGIPGEVPPNWPPSDVLGWAPFVHFGL